MTHTPLTPTPYPPRREMHIKQLEIQTQTSQSRILILNNELKRVTEALDSAYSDSDESDTDTDNNRMVGRRYYRYIDYVILYKCIISNLFNFNIT